MAFKLLDQDGTILSTSLFRHIASACAMLPGREDVLQPDEEEEVAVEEQEKENTGLGGQGEVNEEETKDSTRRKRADPVYPRYD